MKIAGIIFYNILFWSSIILVIFSGPIYWIAAAGTVICFGIFIIRYIERHPEKKFLKEPLSIDHRTDEEIMDYTRALLELNKEFPGVIS